MTIISDRTFNYRIITPSLPVGKKKSLYSYVLNSQNTFPPHTHTQKKRHSKYKGIITANPPGVWPVFTLPTRGLKLYTLPT